MTRSALNPALRRRATGSEALLDVELLPSSSTGRGVHHQALLAIGALSVLGTLAELTILGHYDSLDQLIPYAVLALLAVGLWRARRAITIRTRRALRVLGLLGGLASVLGAWLHYHANLELAREINPTIHVFAYLWSGVTGKIPLLAPLVLAQISLILLAVTVERRAGADVDREGRSMS